MIRRLRIRISNLWYDYRPVARIRLLEAETRLAEAEYELTLARWDAAHLRAAKNGDFLRLYGLGHNPFTGAK